MAGLRSLFKYNQLMPICKHRDCHAVIDGSNILHMLQNKDWLTDFAEYGVVVRNFFQVLRNSNITPHILLDGPNKGDSAKITRTRRRRHGRLENLLRAASGDPATKEINVPSGMQDIFRDIARELDIEIVQVVGDRDFTVEIVAYAKHLDALVISGNTKFFLQDLPRGCMMFHESWESDPSKLLEGPTVHYSEFAKLIRLDLSKNPKAPSMWFALMQGGNLGNEYFEKFVNSFKTRNRTDFRNSGEMRLNFPQRNNYMRVSLNVLDFLRQHTAEQAERQICAQMMGKEREAAVLVLRQVRAAHDVPGEDVVERLETKLDSHAHFDLELPEWFIRAVALESKIVPGLLDTVIQRVHFMMVFLEDTSRVSANESSLRLRRVVYAVLLGSAGANSDEDEVYVNEIDRVGVELEDIPVSPLYELWDPENPDEPLKVPDLVEVDTYDMDQKSTCFLLSMTLRRSLKLQVGSNSLFLVAALKYWVNCAEKVTRRDVINVLLMILLLEKRRGLRSGVFIWPVSLRKNVDLRKFDEPKGIVRLRIERMHPLAQLQSIIVFARTLYRVLQDPYGDKADAVWEFFSERVFHHLAGRTQDAAEHASPERVDDELDALLEELLDSANKSSFEKIVDLIWNNDDKMYAQEILDHEPEDPVAFD